MRGYGYGASDVGRRRLTNEDAFLVDDELGLYAVADGMGGHNAGDVASQEALDAMFSMAAAGRKDLEAVRACDPEALDAERYPESVFRALRLLESAVQSAAYIVFGIAQHNPDRRGMGTTLSVLAIRGETGLLAQVGDSRIYLLRQGQISQLTEDHTLVAWQLKQGLITEEQALVSRQRNIITRAVGSHEYVQVDTRCLRVRPGDRFLLCSDGLYGYLDDQEIADALALEPASAVERMIQMANERGGRDNITAVVVEHRAR